MLDDRPEQCIVDDDESTRSGRVTNHDLVSQCVVARALRTVAEPHDPSSGIERDEAVEVIDIDRDRDRDWKARRVGNCRQRGWVADRLHDEGRTDVADDSVTDPPAFQSDSIEQKSGPSHVRLGDGRMV